jgi:hypothetical protein
MPSNRTGYSQRELGLIRYLVTTNAEISHSSIAQLLNNCYPADNGRSRGKDGVYQAIAEIKTAIEIEEMRQEVIE